MTTMEMTDQEVSEFADFLDDRAESLYKNRGNISNHIDSQAINRTLIEFLRQYDSSRQATKRLFDKYIASAEGTTWLNRTIQRAYALCFALGNLLSDAAVHERLLRIVLLEASFRKIEHQLSLMPGRKLTDDEIWECLKRAVEQSHGNNREWQEIQDFSVRHNLSKRRLNELAELVSKRKELLRHSCL